MKKRTKAIMLLVCIALLSFLTVFVSAKYADFKFITQNLTLKLTNDGEYVEGSEYEHLKNVPSTYHLLYVTFNGTKNVIAAEDIYEAATDLAKIRGQITDTRDNIYANSSGFMGWSLTGMYSTSHDNMIEPYKEQKITISRLMAQRTLLRVWTSEEPIDLTSFYGVAMREKLEQENQAQLLADSENQGKASSSTNTEVILEHTYILLYDMYDSFPTLQIQKHSAEDEFESENDYVVIDPYVWFNEQFMQAAWEEYENSSSSSGFFGGAYSSTVYSNGVFWYLTEEYAKTNSLSDAKSDAEKYVTQTGKADYYHQLATTFAEQSTETINEQIETIESLDVLEIINPSTTSFSIQALSDSGISGQQLTDEIRTYIYNQALASIKEQTPGISDDDADMLATWFVEAYEKNYLYALDSGITESEASLYAEKNATSQVEGFYTAYNGAIQFLENSENLIATFGYPANFSYTDEQIKANADIYINLFKQIAFKQYFLSLANGDGESTALTAASNMANDLTFICVSQYMAMNALCLNDLQYSSRADEIALTYFEIFSQKFVDSYDTAISEGKTYEDAKQYAETVASIYSLACAEKLLSLMETGLTKEQAMAYASIYAEIYQLVYAELYDYAISLSMSAEQAHEYASTVAESSALTGTDKYNFFYELAVEYDFTTDEAKELAYAFVEEYVFSYAGIYATIYQEIYRQNSDAPLAKETADYYADIYIGRFDSVFDTQYNTVRNTLSLSLVDYSSYKETVLEQFGYIAMYSLYDAEKYVQLLFAGNAHEYANLYAGAYAKASVEGEGDSSANEYALIYVRIYQEQIANGQAAEDADVYAQGYAWVYPSKYNSKYSEQLSAGKSEEYAKAYAQEYARVYSEEYATAYLEGYLTNFDEALNTYVGYGLYLNQQRYVLTKDNPVATFIVHPGLYVSSGTGSVKGITSDANYFIYLFEEENSNIFTESEVNGEVVYSVDESKICKGIQILPNEEGSVYYLYAYDTTVKGGHQDDDATIPMACFTTGTLITLADGSKIPVEQLTDEHLLRVYDHENGCYTYAYPLLINYDGDKEYTIARLEFADGEVLEIINERGLFDITLNKYVYITPDNCADFVGHLFAKEQAEGIGAVELISAYKTTKITGCYSVTSTYYINHFINGYLTVPGGIHWFVNYFEYGENLKYDQEAMEKDLAIYGQFTLDEIITYLPSDLVSKFTYQELELIFNNLYPAKYLKVTVGKGLASISDIVTVINDWIVYYDLSGKLE